MVGAPEPVAGLAGLDAGPGGCNGGRAGSSHQPSSARMRPDRQLRAGPRRAVGPPPQPPQPEARRAACRRRPRACWPGCRRGRAPPGSASGPAISQPRVRLPGRLATRTWTRVPRRHVSHGLQGACSFMPLRQVPIALLSAKLPGYWPKSAPRQGPWGTRINDAEQPQNPDRRRRHRTARRRWSSSSRCTTNSRRSRSIPAPRACRPPRPARSIW